jgi:hypothetical protein
MAATKRYNLFMETLIVIRIENYWWLPTDSTYLASPPNIPDLSVGHHICHHYDKRYILMRSATFDTLSKPMLPEEVMYFNIRTFFIWLGRFFQFTIIKQRSSTYKSSSRLFNQIDDRIQGE